MAISNVGEFPLIYPRERPLSDDINQIATMAWNQFMYLLAIRKGVRTNLTSGAYSHETASLSNGFFGTGFQVVTTGVGMGLTLRPGIGVQLPSDPADWSTTNMNGAQGASDLTAYKLLNSVSSIALTVPTADATNPRIDILEVKFDRDFSGSTSRDVFDPSSLAFTPTLLSKLADMTLALGDVGYVTSPASSTTPIGYKTGVPAGSPVEPTTTAGYVKIARINVPATTTTALPEHIVDYRNPLYDGGLSHFIARFDMNTAASAGACTLLSFIGPPGVKIGASVLAAAPIVGFTNPIELYIATPAGALVAAHATIADSNLLSVAEYGQLATTIAVAERDIFNGTTPGYTILPSNSRFAEGQPVTQITVSGRTSDVSAFGGRPVLTVHGCIMSSAT